MRQRLSLLIAFIGVLGLVGFAPVANAGHDIKGDDKEGPHEHSPAPPVPPQIDGECLVIGEVFIGNFNQNGGVSLDPGEKNHNHFKFEETEIQCEALSAQGQRYAGAYEVDAAGGTDGQGGQEGVPDPDNNGVDECDNDPLTKDPQCPDANHGENISVGWSHSSCYDDDAPNSKSPHGCDPPANHKDPKVDLDDLYDGLNENPDGSGQCTNCGEITVRGIDVDKISDPNDPNGDPLSANNFVKFCRGVYDDGHHSPLPTCTNEPQGGTHVSTGGGNVLAWGALTHIVGADKPIKDEDADGNPDVLCFLADLEFVPVPAEKINTAELTGTASTWVDKSGDKNACHGKKKDKPKS